MAPNGPLYASTGSDDGSGHAVWSNPANATGAVDGQYTSVSWAVGVTTSNYLLLQGFQFNLPDNAVIDGFVVQVMGYSANATVAGVQLLLSGIRTTSVYGTGTVLPTSARWMSFGGSSDTWGWSWKPADINASEFGVSVQLQATSGSSGTAFIDGVTVTTYWHVPTADVPVRFAYQSFDSAGNYIGLLPNVTSNFELSQEINTTGSQISVEVGVSADTAYLPIANLTDEGGNILTDESGTNTLTTESVAPILEIGSSGTGALIKNGNKIKVYRYDYYNPNGKCVFQGRMERWAAAFGGSGEDNVTITCYSDGADTDNYVIRPAPTVDQSQTATDTNITLLNTQTIGPAQKITPGAGVYDIPNIDLCLGNSSTTSTTARILVYASSTGAASLGRYNSGATPDAYADMVVDQISGAYFTFTLAFTLPSPAPDYYIIAVQNLTSIPLSVYGTTSGTYAGGNAINASPLINLAFKTRASSSSTQKTYTTYDPTRMLFDFLTTYNSVGGLLTTNTNYSDLTGLSLGWSFNTNTVTEGVRACLSLAPYGFYYFVDLGTDILYFKQTHTTPDLIFIKGRHLEALNLIATIENIKNDAFVTGALVSGSNIFVERYNTTSVNKYGRHIDRLTDPHIPDTTTAAQVASSYVAEYKDEQYQTTLTVVDKTMDITQLKPGLVIGFSGFGTFVDGLLAQIVRIDFKPEEATLTLGILPKRLIPQFEKVIRGLVAEQTINNPSTPS